MKNLFSLALILFITGFQCACKSHKADPNHLVHSDALVVFLVRHAEKMDQSRDPDLSPQGLQRSKLLAQMLSDSGIEHIHSSDYKRTRNTAQPLADQLGLDVQIYDPRELETLASQLKKMGGTHLVVGHSNTTPTMVSLLGGEPGSAIDDTSEYDRLYIVTITHTGQVSSKLLRYGK